MNVANGVGKMCHVCLFGRKEMKIKRKSPVWVARAWVIFNHIFMKALPDYPFDDLTDYGAASAYEGQARFSLILNNTAAYHRHRHFGPNHVMRRLVQGLVDIDLPPLVYANEKAGLDLVMDTLDRPPSLVVLNGEGTLNNDRPRALMLLNAARDLHARGIPTVLVNTIWQENSDDTLALLDHFDLITARENKSHAQILRRRPDALLVPDLLLSADMDVAVNSGTGIGVVDSSAREKSLALMRYAATQGHPFYAMERRLVNKPHLVRKMGLDAKAIQTPMIGDIFNHHSWVVGRFHFAMALLVHGIPFAAQPTQVHKMQAMLHDADFTGCLLPDDWGDLPTDAMQMAVQSALDSWDQAALERAQDYVKSAQAKSNDMFAKIAALVSI